MNEHTFLNEILAVSLILSRIMLVGSMLVVFEMCRGAMSQALSRRIGKLVKSQSKLRVKRNKIYERADCTLRSNNPDWKSDFWVSETGSSPSSSPFKSWLMPWSWHPELSSSIRVIRMLGIELMAITLHPFCLTFPDPRSRSMREWMLGFALVMWSPFGNWEAGVLL